MSDYIWYASYGSNLLEERFLCYICGGQPKGAIKRYNGCVDKSLPIKKKGIEVPYRLYFAKKAKIWNGGGVAFIHHEKDASQQTLARIYLIKKAQFLDVVMQENALTSRPLIDFEQIIDKGKQVLDKAGWYDLLLHLGEEEGAPIFTFTTRGLFQPYTPPHESYLSTIIRGIKESHQWTDQAISNYLIQKEGIISNYSDAELSELIRKSI
ncbi:hypothetical protein IFO69_09150 [Echinicola sp. CAU 1574]|uniref:Histone deacetylase n=1 Tax=Echinicola arenosa TaxID=2774144 RepID=A0ABR9AJ99_9BACT|nr:hypothetical protein [Echinicola arenosa]MBD8488909.1 hypothetical protein [Echinicola arenosa]